jgi:hypothetical protein
MGFSTSALLLYLFLTVSAVSRIVRWKVVLTYALVAWVSSVFSGYYADDGKLFIESAAEDAAVRAGWAGT